MTFEMLMAAMALMAKADRRSGNYPDYDMEEMLIRQQEKEYDDYLREMEEKYPRDWYNGHFLLHCKIYIPAYGEMVNCMIEPGGIHVCKHEVVDGIECYLMVLYGGGYEYFEGDDYWIAPEKYNDRTGQMNPITVEALGYAISCGVAKLSGKFFELEKYEKKVNDLVNREGLLFNGSKFDFQNKNTLKTVNLYEYASKGIDLDVVPNADDNISPVNKRKNESIPYETISYAGKDYIVIPYSYGADCICIADNVIMVLAIEEETFVLDITKKTLVVKVNLRDPFTRKIMNRKDRYEQLKEEDRQFYNDVFIEAGRLNRLFEDNACLNNIREELIEVIENGLLGKQMSVDELNNKMSKLSGKSYACNYQTILCNDKEVSLYQYCKDVYEHKEEKEMGLFDNFFSNSTDTKVLNYIKSMSRTELTRTVKSEYERIKGSCRYTPAMGEFGSIEFAGALLIWKYCRENIHSNLNVCGELMIMLGETIGCAYNCMSPREWSDKMDVVINNNDLLDYTEWNQIYNYLKENYLDEIQGLEFNVGNLSQQQRSNTYADFVVKYNSMDDYGSVFEYYKRQGLWLKDDMPFNIN